MSNDRVGGDAPTPLPRVSATAVPPPGGRGRGLRGSAGSGVVSQGVERAPNRGPTADGGITESNHGMRCLSNSTASTRR